MKKIAFVVEPSSQLFNREKEDIFLIDSNVVVYYSDKDKNEKEIKSLNLYDTYFQTLKQSSKILTSMPPIGEVYDKISELLKAYDIVIGVPLSKYLSNTFSAWKSLEQDFSNKFYTVDVEDIEIGIDWTIQYIKQISKDFDNFETLQNLLNARRTKIINYVVLTDFNKLVASGRISKIKSKVVKFLKVKLILNLSAEEKKLVIRKKEFKTKSVVDFFIKSIKKHQDYKDNKSIKNISLLSSIENENKVGKIIQLIENKINVKINITKISPIVAAHTGIDAFGLYVEFI